MDILRVKIMDVLRMDTVLAFCIVFGVHGKIEAQISIVLYKLAELLMVIIGCRGQRLGVGTEEAEKCVAPRIGSV